MKSFFLALSALSISSLLADDFLITGFGAKAGCGLNTAAIQSAIDAAAKNGGRVVVPAGVFVSGTLHMKSGVELHLEKGAVLKASGNLADYNQDGVYPENHGSAKEKWSNQHFIIAYSLKGFSITGPGTIDGSSEAFFDKDIPPPRPRANGWIYGMRRAKMRPGQMVAVVKCADVFIGGGVTFKSSPCWTLFFYGCENVKVSGYNVRNGRSDANTDGIDIDCCRNVLVEDADIVTGDDAVAIRANGRHFHDNIQKHVCENITVRNSKFHCEVMGVRIGVGQGIIRNVRIENCRAEHASVGVSFETIYGGTPVGKGVDIENVVVDGLVTEDVYANWNLSVGGDMLTTGVRGIVFRNCTFAAVMERIYKRLDPFAPYEEPKEENCTFREYSGTSFKRQAAAKWRPSGTVPAAARPKKAAVDFAGDNELEGRDNGAAASDGERLPPIIQRVVPVEPLLTQVDAATGFIRFVATGDTNGCEIVATVNGCALGPLAPGDYEVVAQLVEKSTGKVRVESRYPFTAVDNASCVMQGRRLNNFVTELHSGTAKDGVISFKLDRDAWVWFGLSAWNGKTRGFVDKETVPVLTVRADEPTEGFRYLAKGVHSLRLADTSGGTVRIHLVKYLPLGQRYLNRKESDLSIGHKGIGWDFYRRYVLPSANEVASGKLRVAKNVNDDAKRLVTNVAILRGRKLRAAWGVRPTDYAAHLDRDFVHSRLGGMYWCDRFGYSLVFDEIGLKMGERALNYIAEETWHLADRFDNRSVWAWYYGLLGRPDGDLSPQRSLIAAVVNSGRGTGFINSETYVRARPTLAEIDASIGNLVTNAERICELVPAARGKIVHSLSGYQLPGYWTSHVIPQVDPKVLAEYVVRRMATEREFADIGGLGMASGVCSEETLRWSARIIHHYAIEGRTDCLYEKFGWKYEPETVTDGDFMDGLKHWRAEAAEPGSLAAGRDADLARKVEGRNGTVGEYGQHFALFTKSAAGSNRLSQTVRNLVPGRFYGLTFVTADYDQMLALKAKKKPCGKSANSLSAEIAGVPFATEHSWEEVAGGGKKPDVRTTFRVFKADATEATLVLSDGGVKSKPGSRTLVNYVSINPYYNK